MRNNVRPVSYEACTMKTTLASFLFVVAAVTGLAQADTSSPLLTATKQTDTDQAMIDRIKQNSLPAQFGLYYSQSIPQSSLRAAYDSLGGPNVGYGFALNGGYNFDPIPLVVGGEFAMHFFGTRERTFGSSSLFSDRVELSTQNFTIPILAFARLQGNIATWVYPYVEVVGGATIYSSVLTAKKYKDGEEIPSETESEGGANLTYGVGAGFAVKIADVITLPNSLQRTLIDVRMRYLWGTSVEVPLVEPTANQSFVIRNVSVDAPEQIVFQLGIMIQL